MSGVQVWKKQVLTCSKDHFAFASTLAVHVYDKKTFQLTKLLTFADKNITAISWCPTDPSVIAQGTNDKVLILWDIETETVKFKTQLESHVVHAEWSPVDKNMLFLIQSNGKALFFHLDPPSLLARRVQNDESSD